MAKERWKAVAGFAGIYDVSDRGRVRSHHKIGRPTKSGILSQQTNGKGYKRVRLAVRCVGFSIVVHRLVLDAFVGPPPSVIHQANHKNGKKADNRVENLEWVTPVENNAHSVALGLWHPHVGENHGRHKLKETDIPVIRALQGKSTPRQVADKYGVTPTAIKLIWRRINWKHVP